MCICPLQRLQCKHRLNVVKITNRNTLHTLYVAVINISFHFSHLATVTHLKKKYLPGNLCADFFFISAESSSILRSKSEVSKKFPNFSFMKTSTYIKYSSLIGHSKNHTRFYHESLFNYFNSNFKMFFVYFRPEYEFVACESNFPNVITL